MRERERGGLLLCGNADINETGRKREEKGPRKKRGNKAKGDMKRLLSLCWDVKKKRLRASTSRYSTGCKIPLPQESDKQRKKNAHLILILHQGVNLFKQTPTALFLSWRSEVLVGWNVIYCVWNRAVKAFDSFSSNKSQGKTPINRDQSVLQITEANCLFKIEKNRIYKIIQNYYSKCLLLTWFAKCGRSCFQNFSEAVKLNNWCQSTIPHNPSDVPVSHWLIYCPALSEDGLTWSRTTDLRLKPQQTHPGCWDGILYLGGGAYLSCV